MNKATLIAIIAIAALEGVALWKGIDGAGLASAFAIIGGLGGYEVSQSITKRKGGK